MDEQDKLDMNSLPVEKRKALKALLDKRRILQDLRDRETGEEKEKAAEGNRMGNLPALRRMLDGANARADAGAEASRAETDAANSENTQATDNAGQQNLTQKILNFLKNRRMDPRPDAPEAPPASTSPLPQPASISPAP